MTIYAHHGGIWKPASARARHAGVWKTPLAWARHAGVWKTLRGLSQTIDRTAGTNIGNMTTGGGLASAFDGVTTQGRSNTASRPSASAQSGYVGKTLAKPTAIESAMVFGSSDEGYVDANPEMSLTLYGKVGAAPASATDGTVLGSIVFFDTGNESVGRQIVSTDTMSYWDHVWVYLQQPNNQGIHIAELQLIGWQ